MVTVWFLLYKMANITVLRFSTGKVEKWQLLVCVQFKPWELTCPRAVPFQQIGTTWKNLAKLGLFYTPDFSSEETWFRIFSSHGQIILTKE